MTTAIIIDDEPVARRRLRRMLTERTDISIIAECAGGEAGVAAIKTQKPDLVFIEFAVNDWNETEKTVRESLEGIIRQLLLHPQPPEMDLHHLADAPRRGQHRDDPALEVDPLQQPDIHQIPAGADQPPATGIERAASRRRQPLSINVGKKNLLWAARVG